MRDAVLQRGVRADEAAPGSGLGLAIVRDLAELYGGSIALGRSRLGGLNARFCSRLPLKHRTEVLSGEGAGEVTAGQARLVCFQPRTMSLDRPTARGEDDPRYEGWRVVAASSVGVFVGFGSLLVYTFGIFLKPLAEQFSWSREAVSAAFGFAAISVAICSPLLGLLFDRLTPRRVILPCLAVFGCAFASLALLTPHLWHLYAVFAVLGCVGNGTAQMGYSRAVSSWFLRRRGMALAVVMSGGAIGAMVLPPVAQWLMNTIGWRSAALTLGAMVLVVGLPMVAGFIRERPAEPTGRDVRPEGASVGEGVMSRVFAILVVVLFVNSIAQNGAITHLSALLDRPRRARVSAPPSHSRRWAAPAFLAASSRDGCSTGSLRDASPSRC